MTAVCLSASRVLEDVLTLLVVSDVTLLVVGATAVTVLQDIRVSEMVIVSPL